MKYIDLVNLMNGNIIAISSRALEPGDSYEVAKFKIGMRKAFEQYQEKEEGLLKEAGIENAQEFFNKHNMLVAKQNKDSIDEGLIEENKKKIGKFNEMQAKLQKEEVEIEGFKPISFDSWRRLQEANKELKINNFEMLALYEAELEGILWSAPVAEAE